LRGGRRRAVKASDPRVQVLFRNGFAVHDGDQPFHHVLKLTIITGPGKAHETPRCGGHEALEFDVRGPAVFVQKLPPQDRNNLGDFPQRRCF